MGPLFARSMVPTLVLILSLCGMVTAGIDFATCLIKLQNGTFGTEGAVDYHGHPVSNASLATGLTYHACEKFCGPGHEAFQWSNFSDQFSAWLLPWLAIISQLPYGADDSLKNFEAMILAVGSPMLAAYSLALSVNGSRWLTERFRRSEYPNNYFAADIASTLQQVSFNLPEDHVLESLIVLRKNDQWWQKLHHGLERSEPQWSLAAIISMLYVVLAYALSWANTISSSSGTQAYPNGQSLGSIWLSLLPIVICTLQLSPAPIFRITKALRGANKEFYIGENDDSAVKHDGDATITVRRARENMVDEDIICPTPIFFFARFPSWFRAASKLADHYYAASQSQRASRAVPSSQSRRSSKATESPVTPLHTRSESFKIQSDYSYDLVNIQIKSVLLALFLQWGTAGAALMAMYLTPTQGLGCRAGSQLLFLCAATLVWFFSALSGVLTHVYVTSEHKEGGPGAFGGLAIALRQMSKVLAALNALWILAASLLQIVGFESSCFCKSNVLGLGKGAYALLMFPPDKFGSIKAYWIAGMAFASGTALVFIIAINVLIKQPKLRPTFENHGQHLLR